jgi:hypothetical protein
MKHLVVATMFALVFGLVSVAQTTPGTAQSPQSKDPSAMPQSSPSQASPAETPNMSNRSASASDTKGEKKLKGCIESEGGKYVLREKNGKEVALTGSEDLSSHVGQTVTVHGTYASGSDASSATGTSSTTMGTSSSGSMSSGGDQFMVSKIDMVSQSCSMDKGKTSSKNRDDSGKPSPNLR